MDIGTKLAQLEKRLERMERQSRLSSAAIDDTHIEVRDGAGSLRAQIGQQADGTTAVNVTNGPPPPTPSVPIVASVLGGVTASWNGTFEGGAVLPLDWSRTEVHASTSTGFTPTAATLVSTIETAQGATVVVPTDDPVYVRLLARNTSGTASGPSAQAGPTGPAPVVATDILDGIVTTTKLADDAVTAAKVAAGAIESDAIAASAVTAAKIGTAAVTAGKLAAESVDLTTLLGPLADLAGQRYADYMSDPAAWEQLSASAGATWVINPAATGTPSGRGLMTVTGSVQLAGKVLIPQDSDTLYRVMVRIRATAQDPSGPATVYIGAVGVADDRTTLVNRAGANSTSMHYYAATNGGTLGTADGWKVYVGYLQGHSGVGVTAPAGPQTDPRAPGTTHADVRYLRPHVWANFGKNTSAVMEVDAVIVEALRTGVVGSTNLVTGSVTAGAIATDAVIAGKVAADAITARELTTGSVTTAKIFAGAVTTTELAANAVTAGKIAASQIDATHITAGAINTAALAADAVAAGKIAADAVTAREIAALAITTAKLDANAVTTAKLAAGSVDATALKADAITGKTITGGTINGAEFHSNDGAGGLVDILNGTITATDATGWQIAIDPTQTFPVISWRLPGGATAGTINGNISDTIPGLSVGSGSFTDGAITDWRWFTYMGVFNDGTNGWRVRRSRHSDVNRYLGGQIMATPTWAGLSFVDSVNPTTNTHLQVFVGEALLTNGRMVMDPPVSANSALFIRTATGHTGRLIRAQLNSVDMFQVMPNGDVTAAGVVTGTRSVVVPPVSGSASVFVNAATGHTGMLFRGDVNGSPVFQVTPAGDVIAEGGLTVSGRELGRGLTASAIRTSNIGSITTTNVAVLTTGSMTWKTGRAYRVSMTGLMSSTTTGTYVNYQIVKGTLATGTVIRGNLRMLLAQTFATHHEFNIVVTNTTGADITTAITTTASVAAGTGTFTASAAAPCTLTVEDVGLAADWPGTPIT